MVATTMVATTTINMRPIATIPMMGQNVMTYLGQGGYFPNTFQFQDLIDKEPNSVGQQNRGNANWAPVTGYEAIRGVKSPEYAKSMRGSAETKKETEIQDVDSAAVLLSGYYPNIEKTWRVLDDEGLVWDIKGVESDSHKSMTRMKLERFKL